MGDFFTLPTNVTNFQQLLIYNNSITHDLFGVSLLLTVFAITFVSTMGWPRGQNLVSSLWITAITSVFFWLMQLISSDIMVVLAILTALATVFLFRTREN